MKILGVLFLFWLFDIDAFIAIGMAIITYFALDLPVGFCTIFALILNSLVQLKVIFFTRPGWSLEVAGCTMMIFQKVIATSNNLQAGKEIKNRLRPKREFNRRLAILEKPSLIRWLSYCLSFFGASCGPSYEYKIYEYTLSIGSRPPLDPNSKSAKVALRKYLSSFLSILSAGYILPLAKISFYQSEFYLNRSLPVRILLIFLLTILQFSRYLPAWHAVEAASYQFGIAESDLLLNFDDISNKELLVRIFSRSAGQWSQEWNHSTHLNLKRYIFYPLYDNGYGYFLAHNSVYIVSALWHGFHPVLYLGLPEMLFSTLADTIFLKHFPQSPNDPIWRKIIDVAWMWFAMLGPTCTWCYRTYSSFILVRNTVYWIPPLINVLAFVVAEIVQMVHKAPPSKKMFTSSSSSAINDPQIITEITRDMKNAQTINSDDKTSNDKSKKDE